MNRRSRAAGLLVALCMASTAQADAPHPWVVGGQPAAEGAWPDVAAVLFSVAAGCTGTLIAPDLVVTAAHCTESQITHVKLDAPNWVTKGYEIGVAEVIVYPNWEDSYDAAVLVLEEEAPYTPRTIAQGCILEDDLYDGAPVAVVGYGATEADGEGFTFQLNEGFTVVTDHDCSQVERGCVDAVSPGGEIGGGENGIDACFGDSGGPLYLLTARGDYLVGITSRAWHDVGDLPCFHGGIYVRPDALIDWIEAETGRTLPEPVCGYPPDPISDPISLASRRRGKVRVDPNDPDLDDTHTFTVVSAPSSGTARVRHNGTAIYRADRDFVGEDQFTIRVTDDSEWSLSQDIVVAVSRESTGGCATHARTVGWGGWLALVVLVRRRRAA